MYSKMSFRNLKRSFKDYAVYFLTLAFGVCIFYMFNSIESQSAMLQISESQEAVLKGMNQIMGYISIFVSMILGFLVIYANGFLIKRRKKELGIYMTLGMEKGKISKILVVETFMIGLLSLAVGLIAGVFMSQGLSVVTAKLFAVNMNEFKFIFSMDAFTKSALCFGVIFLLVMIFNVLTISKYELIDLLNASKKNQEMKIKSTKVSIVLFILSIIFLALGYGIVLKTGLTNLNAICILFGIIGTFLFFASLSGFLLKMIQSNKRVYFKGLNMFVARQINSKINTVFVSISMICLMLFFTIGILSTGIGMSGALTKNLEIHTPFDISTYTFDEKESIGEVIEGMGVDIDKYSDDYYEYSLYDTNIKTKDLFGNNGNNKAEQAVEKYRIEGIKLSDYNNIMKNLGEKEITLNNNEFAIIYNQELMKEKWESILANMSVNIQGKDYVSKFSEAIKGSIATSYGAHNSGIIILPDDALSGLKQSSSNMNITLKGKNKEEEANKFAEEIGKASDKNEYYFPIENKYEIYDGNLSLKTMISYIGIYIGFVFLITSAAVLALQQLSEAADNVERYNLLKKVGVDQKDINKAMFAQIGIYFMIPLSLAIVHSIVGIKVANDVVEVFGKVDILGNVIFTAVFIGIIYGGYFLATYLGAKSMLKYKD